MKKKVNIIFILTLIMLLILGIPDAAALYGIHTISSGTEELGQSIKEDLNSTKNIDDVEGYAILLKVFAGIFVFLGLLASLVMMLFPIGSILILILAVIARLIFSATKWRLIFYRFLNILNCILMLGLSFLWTSFLLSAKLSANTALVWFLAILPSAYAVFASIRINVTMFRIHPEPVNDPHTDLPITY